MAEWTTDIPQVEIIEFSDQAKLKVLCEELPRHREVAIDTETTGLNVFDQPNCPNVHSRQAAIPLLWSLSFGPPGKEKIVVLDAACLGYFDHVFGDPDRRWFMHNAKYDTHILANVDHHVAGELHDTSVMHALIHEESIHGLKQASADLLNLRWGSFTDTFGREDEDRLGPGVRLLRLWQSDKKSAANYAGMDAYATLRLGRHMQEELAKEPVYTLFPEQYSNMLDVFEKTEVPFTKSLWRCERNGVLVDFDRLQRMRQPIIDKLNQIKRDIAQTCNRLDFNPMSSQHIRDLAVSMQLTSHKRTKGGKTGVRNFSYDSEFLEAHQHLKIFHDIIEYKGLYKLLGTYIDGLSKVVDSDNRVHTRYNQDVARTGRLSSSEPNTQNIPTLENDVFGVRNAFIARPGYLLVVIDYQALEMRLLAAASGEPDMVQIFLDGKDIHMGNASLIFGIPYEDIVAAKKTDKKVKEGELGPESMTAYVRQCLDARSQAKTIGFGQPTVRPN